MNSLLKYNWDTLNKKSTNITILSGIKKNVSITISKKQSFIRRTLPGTKMFFVNTREKMFSL